MTYGLEISEQLDSKLKRLSKRSRKRLEIIAKKVGQILEDPHHFKPLKGDMKGGHRVHIDRSFVRVYEIDESSHVVRLLDLEHHDKVYPTGTMVHRNHPFYKLRALCKYMFYRVLLRKEPEGGYTVIVPSLSGCITYGETVEGAKEMAREAIVVYLESLKEHGEEIPTEEETNFS